MNETERRIRRITIAIVLALAAAGALLASAGGWSTGTPVR